MTSIQHISSNYSTVNCSQLCEKNPAAYTHWWVNPALSQGLMVPEVGWCKDITPCIRELTICLCAPPFPISEPDRAKGGATFTALTTLSKTCSAPIHGEPGKPPECCGAGALPTYMVLLTSASVGTSAFAPPPYPRYAPGEQQIKQILFTLFCSFWPGTHTAFCRKNGTLFFQSSHVVSSTVTNQGCHNSCWHWARS